MTSDPEFIWDDATMGDAWLQLVGAGRPPFLVVKKKEDATISGWITIGILSDRWPTIIWRDIGLTATEHAKLVEDIAKAPVKNYMVQLGQLEYLLPSFTVSQAMQRFCEPIYNEGRQLTIRSFPVRDNKFRCVGVLTYWHLIKWARDNGLFPDITVEECMLDIESPFFRPVYDNVTLRDVELLVDTEGWTSVVVTSPEMELIGMISREKIKQITDERFPRTYEVSAKPYLRKPENLQIAAPSDKLDRWLSLFIDDRQIDSLPVIKDGKLVGIIRYIEILSVLNE